MVLLIDDCVLKGESVYGLNNVMALRSLQAGSAGVIQTVSNARNPLLLKQVDSTVADGNTLGVFVSSLQTTFDILAFRIAEATQKWKEVTQCAKQGYKEQLEAHFNVKLS